MSISPSALLVTGTDACALQKELFPIFYFLPSIKNVKGKNCFSSVLPCTTSTSKYITCFSLITEHDNVLTVPIKLYGLASNKNSLCLKFWMITTRAPLLEWFKHLLEWFFLEQSVRYLTKWVPLAALSVPRMQPCLKKEVLLQLMGWLSVPTAWYPWCRKQGRLFNEHLPPKFKVAVTQKEDAHVPLLSVSLNNKCSLLGRNLVIWVQQQINR